MSTTLAPHVPSSAPQQDSDLAMVLKSRYFQIGSIVLGTLLIVILLASIVAYIYYRRSLKKKQSQPKDLEASPVKDMFAPQMFPCAAYSSASIANTIAIPAIEEHAAPPGKDEDGDALDHFTPDDLRQFDPSPSHSFCDRSRATISSIRNEPALEANAASDVQGEAQVAAPKQDEEQEIVASSSVDVEPVQSKPTELTADTTVECEVQATSAPRLEFVTAAPARQPRERDEQVDYLTIAEIHDTSANRTAVKALAPAAEPVSPSAPAVRGPAIIALTHNISEISASDLTLRTPPKPAPRPLASSRQPSDGYIAVNPVEVSPAPPTLKRDPRLAYKSSRSVSAQNMLGSPAPVRDTLAVQVSPDPSRPTTIGSLGNFMRKSAPDVLKKRALPVRESSVFPSLAEEQDVELISDTLSRSVPRIKPTQLELIDTLAVGKYGPIFRANLQLRHGGVTQYAVAKSMPNKDKSKDRNLFLQEAERLVMLSHPSILHCFGVMMDASNTYIVLEYIAEQSLRDYLLKHTDLSVSRRIRIATEVACGLAYLEASQVIHGDISCRNILTNHTGGSKITGFSIWPECLTVTKRWRAIEAWESDDYLSSASDVWSLGICLYEIFNGGAVPFDGQSNTTIKRMLDAGNRLPPGPSCPSMVYSLMVRCWHPCPWLRITGEALFGHLLDLSHSTRTVAISPSVNALQSIYIGCRVPLLSEVDAWLANGARVNQEHALSHGELLATLPATVAPCPELDQDLDKALEQSAPNTPESLRRQSRISEAFTVDTAMARSRTSTGDKSVAPTPMMQELLAAVQSRRRDSTSNANRRPSLHFTAPPRKPSLSLHPSAAV